MAGGDTADNGAAREKPRQRLLLRPGVLAHLTRQSIADACGVSPDVVARWQRHAWWIPEARVHQLSRAFNIPIEQIAEVDVRNINWRILELTAARPRLRAQTPAPSTWQKVNALDELTDRAAAEPAAFLRRLMEEPPVRQPKLRRVGRRWRQVSTG